ncbi:hypothetical protein P171DRAFT_521867 [Karstenula rhodostoma CBS 690.94]|uniref:Uncharacterized protein n=1 Tax=Karstenula rhodostoma CBS 690.94 TaxID=1392251 RepID=A0A9P4UAJ1_9PLEO|nr:hypothetical protein P171DRAFT_521867 [Karstenula rhodostoma CBS 690.94]
MAAIHTTSMTITNAVFDLAARPKLRKMDSFLKESHRLSPISQLNMRWKIDQPITLHDRTTLRDLPENESKYQFMGTGANYLGSGYSVHVCPGRDFAANEIKIIVIYLIDSFDIEFKGDVGLSDTTFKRTNHFSDSNKPDNTRLLQEDQIRFFAFLAALALAAFTTAVPVDDTATAKFITLDDKVDVSPTSPLLAPRSCRLPEYILVTFDNHKQVSLNNVKCVDVGRPVIGVLVGECWCALWAKPGCRDFIQLHYPCPGVITDFKKPVKSISCGGWAGGKA